MNQDHRGRQDQLVLMGLKDLKVNRGRRVSKERPDYKDLRGQQGRKDHRVNKGQQDLKAREVNRDPLGQPDQQDRRENKG